MHHIAKKNLVLQVTQTQTHRQTVGRNYYGKKIEQCIA